jgi:hypothetical protein
LAYHHCTKCGAYQQLLWSRIFFSQVTHKKENPNCFVTTELFGFVFYFDYPY